MIPPLSPPPPHRGVVYIIGQLTRGGAEQQLFYLLAETAHPSIVISLSRGGSWAGPLRQRGVQVYELPRRHAFEARRFFQLIRLIKQAQPGLVHVFQNAINGLYGRVAGPAAGVSRLIVNERHHPVRYPRWYLKLWPLLGRREVVVCNSKAAADFLREQQLVAQDRLHVIANGVDTELFCPSVPTARPWPSDWNGKVIVTMMARLAPQKNIFAFLSLAAGVLKVCPEARFALIGDGPLRKEIESRIGALGLSPAVLLTGERSDAPELWNASDLAVLTSLHEGMPNVLLEAMACGLPCVATRVGGIPEVIVDGETGFLVPPGDAPALASAVAKLVRNPALRGELGRNGRTRVQTCFSLEKMRSGYENLYRNILEPVPKVPRKA